MITDSNKCGYILGIDPGYGDIRDALPTEVCQRVAGHQGAHISNQAKAAILDDRFKYGVGAVPCGVAWDGKSGHTVCVRASGHGGIHTDGYDAISPDDHRLRKQLDSEDRIVLALESIARSQRLIALVEAGRNLAKPSPELEEVLTKLVGVVLRKERVMDVDSDETTTESGVDEMLMESEGEKTERCTAESYSHAHGDASRASVVLRCTLPLGHAGLHSLKEEGR